MIALSVDRVVEFSCREVRATIRRTGPSDVRGVGFSLAGPLGYLMRPDTPISHWTGERTISPVEHVFDLGVPWPGRIEPRNNYLYGNRLAAVSPSRTRVSTSVGDDRFLGAFYRLLCLPPASSLRVLLITSADVIDHRACQCSRPRP